MVPSRCVRILVVAILLACTVLPARAESDDTTHFTIADIDVSGLVWTGRPGVESTGTVRTKAGVPIDGALVQADGDVYAGSVSRDGVFALRGLTVSTYSISVPAKGYVTPR